MKLRIRYAAEVRDQANKAGFASSVELPGQGGSLGDLKAAILGSNDTTRRALVTLALGSSLLVPPEGQTDENTSLHALGVVHNDIVWVKSLPVGRLGGSQGGPEREEEDPVPSCSENLLPECVKRALGSDTNVVGVIVATAMESIGFERVVGNQGLYRFSVEDEPANTVSVSLSTSVMVSSCMLVAEIRKDGHVSTVARLLRFQQGVSTLDDRLSLFNGLLDAFCVPLLKACCAGLGVACPLETLASLPPEIIEMIAERLPGCEIGREALRSLGLVCKRLAAIVFDPRGVLYRRQLEARSQSIRTHGSARQLPATGRRSYPNPLGGGMGRHIIGGAYDMMPGGFVGLPPRGPTRSSQHWRL